MDPKTLKEQLDNIDERTSLNEIQTYIKNMVEVRGFADETPQDIMLLLIEELGELAKEVRKGTHIKMDSKASREQNLKAEISDVFNYLLCLCNTTNISLLEAFKEKEEKNHQREWK